VEEALNIVSVRPTLSDLDRSLGELWEVAEEDEADKALSRTLTLNLLLVTDEDHAVEMHHLVEELPAEEKKTK
jgi:hypothetical protein